MDQKPNFWATLPGILTGLAALITALTGFYLALRNDAPAAPEQPATAQPAPRPGDGLVTPPAAPQAALPDPSAAPVAAGLLATASLVDCGQEVFKLPNTRRSLMSWSDHYHAQIPTSGGTPARAAYPCQKALAYRGSAHCQAPQDLAIRQALFETLSLCRAAGVDVTDLPAQ